MGTTADRSTPCFRVEDFERSAAYQELMHPDGPRRAASPAVLPIDELHGSLADPALESMNLLNEVAASFPDAVSFAAGRPYEGFYDVDDVHRYLRRYWSYLVDERGCSREQATRLLFQYGRTKGIIHELIAGQLASDEGIRADPDDIVVTVGCQEAMFLTLRALRADHRDTLLSVSPMYVGVTGAARLVDLPVVGIEAGADGVDLGDLAAKADQVRAAGNRPRALYLVSDFSNPSGISLPLATRHRLLELADRLDLLILEDNPYGIFAHGEVRPPTLKSLDDGGRVVYLGSFAKTSLPGARVGFVVAGQRVADAAGADRGSLADQLSKIKSMLTVNTSPLAQAVVAGQLLENGGSSVAANTAERSVYRRHMHRLLDGLARRFPEPHAAGVSWNRPSGGFFVTLTVPFRADDAALADCARRYGVLWIPMHHFYAGPGGLRQIRLSCSCLDPADIDEGLDRLAAFVTDATGKENPG